MNLESICNAKKYNVAVDPEYQVSLQKSNKLAHAMLI